MVVEGTGEAQLQGDRVTIWVPHFPAKRATPALRVTAPRSAAPFYNLNVVAGDPIFVLHLTGTVPLQRDHVEDRFAERRRRTRLGDDHSRADSHHLQPPVQRITTSCRLAVLDTTKAPTQPTHTDPRTLDEARSHPVVARDRRRSSGASGDVLPAVLWGLGFLLGAIALRLGARRLPRPVG